MLCVSVSSQVSTVSTQRYGPDPGLTAVDPPVIAAGRHMTFVGSHATDDAVLENIYDTIPDINGHNTVPTCSNANSANNTYSSLTNRNDVSSQPEYQGLRVSAAAMADLNYFLPLPSPQTPPSQEPNVAPTEYSYASFQGQPHDKPVKNYENVDSVLKN